MSSVKVSTSGERGYSLSVAPEATSFWSPTRAADDVKVAMGAVGEVFAVLPRVARIEVMKSTKDGAEYLVLRLPAGSGLTVDGRQPEGSTSWPHVEVDVRKNRGPQFYDSLEIQPDRTFLVESLYSPTPE